MKIIKSVFDAQNKIPKKYLGFVATMGALHEGHRALINKSKQENDKTCVSIFVNPTQFNNTKDFKTYPRRTDEDLSYCENLGVDYVFIPKLSQIYYNKETVKISEKFLTKNFEGLHRPNHFDGVLQIIMKLLNIISPSKAYFGEKDYQQLKIIKKMVQEYFINVNIISVPILRDSSGLALSSRNYKLSENGLLQARQIATAFLKTNSKKDFLKETGSKLKLEYYGSEWGRTLIAHYVEGVRLIDNKPVKVNT